LEFDIILKLMIIVNASDTYTKISGYRMSVEAYYENISTINAEKQAYI